MRYLAVLIIIFSSLIAQTSTKDKIKDTTAAITKSKAKERTISKKIDDLGAQILSQNKELKNTSNKIDEISGLVINLSEKHRDEEQKLSVLNSEKEALISSKESLEEQMIDLIADDFSFSLVQDDEIKTSDSLLSNEIFKSLNSVVNQELETLLKKYDETLISINKKEKEIAGIEKNLKDYNAKKDELAKAKKHQESLVASLSKDKESYITQLEKASNTSAALSKTLSELKIIDDKEEREKARIAEEKRVKAQEAKLAKEAKKEAASKNKSKQNQPKSESIDEEPVVVQRDRRVEDIDKKVKMYGSSYQQSRVKKYSGARTISPLKNAFVKRKFGNYTDPVYGIKIFNESVILSSRTPNAQVLNVLDGKVIFAKQTPVLDNVIIVENADGIHTIYAHLNQIAPTIKVGSRIKKGYAIGRVNSDLTFEVTQKNYHINPLELISL